MKLNPCYIYSTAAGRNLNWSVSKNGYRVSKVFLNKANRNVYEHVLKFFLCHGYVPECVDHINGNKLDNDVSNLRAATKSQNALNMKTRSGRVKGVTYEGGRWRVRVSVNGVTKQGGRFDSIEEAALVANELRKKLHGEFARDI